MLEIVVRRLGQAIVVTVLVATIVFFLVHLAPGDPFAAALDQRTVSPEVRTRWLAAYGLDRPVGEQYVRYLGSVLRGDLGWSVSQSRPVSAVIATALPNTLLLMGATLAVGFTGGILLGAWQAVRRGTLRERAVGGITLLLHALPDFWLALLLLVSLTYWVRLFPTGGMMDATSWPFLGPWERLLDRLHHLALPAGTLVLLGIAGVARFQRGALLDALGEDYVRTARAKGMPEGRVVMRHALRNALLPTITLFGLAFPAVVTGTVFVEKVFAWPGMGLLLVTAVEQRDHWTATACVLVGSAVVVFGGLVADLLQAAVDPRTRAR